jgi:hypothetical protein
VLWLACEFKLFFGSILADIAGLVAIVTEDEPGRCVESNASNRALGWNMKAVNQFGWLAVVSDSTQK